MLVVQLGAYQSLRLFPEDLGDQFTKSCTQPRTLRAVLTTAMDEPFINRSVTVLLTEDAQRSIVDALTTNLAREA